MDPKEIWIGNDHGGYELKLQLVDHLQQAGYNVVNVGSDSREIVRYPYYAARVAGAVSKGKVAKGILIWSTGIGMSIIANKYRRVRAALCTTTYMAKMTRAHNDSNILCLGGKCIGTFEAFDILDTWLSTAYEGGRHNISLGLVEEAEKMMGTDRLWEPEIPDLKERENDAR
jgi:ribose 5-phosphate isomerase B